MNLETEEQNITFIRPLEDVDLETIIITNLLGNNQFTKEIFPFVKLDYFFESKAYLKHLIEYLLEFYQEYGKIPAEDVYVIRAKTDPKILEPDLKILMKKLPELLDTKYHLFEHNLKWLIKETEDYFQEQSITFAIRNSIDIIDDKAKRGSIIKLIKDASMVSFDTSIGHNYLTDFHERFKKAEDADNGIEFDIDSFNKCFNGKMPRKSLNVFSAGTNVGKSLVMSHMAASNLRSGYNVLYVTLELSDIQVAKRIDANLLDISMSEVEKGTEEFLIARMKQKLRNVHGNLIIRNYTMGSASINDIRFLLEELKNKKDFIPDVVYLDYLNLLRPIEKLRDSALYERIGQVAMETRALAVDYNVALVTATQVNRAGYNSMNIELEHTSQSVDINSHSDWICAIARNEQLDDMNQILFKQLKTRSTDLTGHKKFVVGIERSKMRLYNVDQDFLKVGKNDKEDDASGFDNTPFGKGMKAERSNKYKGIKI